MCLKTIDKITLQVTEGYKDFEHDGDELYTWFCGKRIPYPKGKWINEIDWREHPILDSLFRHKITAHDEQTYPYGFHFYISPRGSRIKILVRNIVASGREDGEQVIVCKEMFIPND